MGVLRLLLALSVVNAHGNNLLGFQFLQSYFAVQTFYLISGFYMALVLNEKYQPGKSTYFEFISNRFLRIFPGYLVVLVLTILLLLTAGWYYGKNFGAIFQWAENWGKLDWPARLFIVFTHLTLLGQDIFLFLGFDGLGNLSFNPDAFGSSNSMVRFMFVPIAWSLSLEFYFYLLAPFLVRRSASVLALIILSSILLRLGLAYLWGWQHDPWSFRFFPSELALFLCGAGAYRVYRVIRLGKMNGLNRLGWLGLGVAVATVLIISNSQNHLMIWLNIAFVAFVAMALPYLFRLTQHSKIDGHIGELSYPMYLCHLPVIWAFGFMRVPSGTERSFGILLTTLVLSILLYWYVDRKVDDFRHRRYSKAHITA